MPDTHPMPPSGVHVLLIDVDSSGHTSSGETFPDQRAVYRDHARVEPVVLRYPDGALKLVQRVIPARTAV